MAEIGRSIREEAEAGYLYHCRQVAGAVFNVRQWGWEELLDAVETVAVLAGVVIVAVCFPVTIPFFGWLRMRMARRRWERYPLRKAEVDALHESRVHRMQSRVQKKEDEPCAPS